MAHLIVTVEARGRHMTLAVPGDVAARDLAQLLVEAVFNGVDANGWTITPRTGRTLDVDESLQSAGVPRGAILQLEPPARPVEAGTSPWPGTGRFASVVAAGLAIVLVAGIAGSTAARLTGLLPPAVADASSRVSPLGSHGGFPAPVRGTLGRPLQIGGVQITVSIASGGGRDETWPQTATGERVVSVKVDYDNTGSTSAVVSPYDWVLVDSRGAVHEPAGNSSLPQRELAPGMRASGLLRFTVAATLPRGLTLLYSAELGYATAAVTVD